MADGLVLYDEDERLVFCNDQFKRMFPKTPGVRVPGAKLVDIIAASIHAGEPAGITAENGDAYIENVRSGLKSGGEWDFEMSDGRWLHARAQGRSPTAAISTWSPTSPSASARSSRCPP